MKPGIARRLAVEAAAILVVAGAPGLVFNARLPRCIAIRRPLTLRDLGRALRMLPIQITS